MEPISLKENSRGGLVAALLQQDLDDYHANPPTHVVVHTPPGREMERIPQQISRSGVTMAMGDVWFGQAR